VAGAVVGGAVVAATTPDTATTTVVATAPATVTAAPPCNVAPTAINGVTYYNCGSTWYAAGYGGDGLVYVPVPPPT
jgi:hypothetical protein